jgi:hypothetical protein
MPTDPRIVTQPPWGRGGGFQTTMMDDAAQLRTVTSLMNDLYRASLPPDDPMYLELSPTALDQHSSALLDWAQYVPDLVSGVRDQLSTQYGFDPTNSPGDNAVATDIFNRLSSSLETSTQTTTTEQGITRTGSESFNRTTGTRVTRYVDKPTPEEFLDDFQNSITTFVQGMRQSGGIDQATADFLQSNPRLLLDNYIADLGARAARGEDIFRVVGVNGENTYLGERAGEASVSEYSGMTRSQIFEQIASSQRDQITSQVRQEYTGASGTTALTADQEQQVTEEVDRRINEQTNRLIGEQISQTGSQTELTTEAVISRPHLTTVFNISPLSFLQNQYTPESLRNLAAGRRGTEEAQARTARGIAPSAPRRVGG